MADYPLQVLDVRPLTTWPGELTPTTARRWSPYRAGLQSTLNMLKVELRAIDASTRAVLEVAIDRRQFRIDGTPMMRAVPEHPGVVLSIPSSAVGALRFAADRYHDWEDNLRAIVLTMEALRAVDRHGAVKRAEQYRGFAAIESGPRAIGGGLTREEAERVLFAAADGVTPGEPLRDVARRARSAAHPDRNNGDRQAWDRVEAAMHVLGLLAG